ncbi:hypothetical protein C0206_02420 [Moraxella catarrhalis]|uniref:hypothetical protein n=1 Tax=Moraxella catarrhalis TaxID=480 RepID=UPI000202A0D1|nr:hypothetical protein [Moraxella catarrhalis]ARE65456.1 hypothetical protein MC195_01280 [Moraxella catarrhalis]EGE21094.1 hypothetical protein E9S_05057 [Moraxella catarrhalis BC7]MPW47612.1 hypothetical protein [Moraxella catarrhalis]MPW48915.1 hypothetical protein [Moraxella catarrhalis]MPW58243.1 hypothetical protein [Moraxella catarrhalis]
MSLPKDKVKPAFNFTYPSERAYFDESKSTLANAQVTDPAKSGADYGIKDPQATEALTGTKSETAKVE